MEGTINSLANCKGISFLRSRTYERDIQDFFLVCCISNFSYTDVLTFLHKQQSMIVEGI